MPGGRVPPQPIVLATSNPAKRVQLRWLLEGLPLRTVDPEPLDVAEDAADLAGNAAAKALAHSSRGLAIASDGGLEVPALGVAWQTVSTRRLGQQRLRQLTAGLSDSRVRWWEAVAIAERGRLLASWTESGTEGVLAPEPWPPPTDFWVWDIFAFPELEKTWSEVSREERAVVDRAWTALKQHVQEFFQAHLSCRP
jgi:inosine/xanthosine triphosphate pyrophosphatase family protein